MIRIARESDLPGLLSLYRELRPHDPVLPPEHAQFLFRAILRNSEVRIVVAEYQETLASTCMLALVPNLASGGRPIGMIEHVVTLSPFRRLGLGEAVLRYALELGWKHKCCKVILLSGRQRVEAHGIYEKVGFRGDIELGFVAKPGDAT